MNLTDKLKSKLVVIITAGIIIPNILYSQNITNTMGSNGSFKIKDGLSTFFTLTQSNGYVELTKSFRLPATTDLNTGVIYKGTERFIHNYKNPNNIGNNTFIGVNSGNFTLGGSGQPVYGSSNNAMGYYSLNSLTLGAKNVAIGSNALQFNTTGNDNIALGHYSLNANLSGSNNVAMGESSLYFNTSGYQNVAVGYSSLWSNTTGFTNIAIGINSLLANTIGSENVAIGKWALGDNIDGNSSTAVGLLSLTNSNGDFNTAIGYNSGANVTTGQNVTLIGYNAQPSSGVIWNQITLGNNQVGSLRCNVQTITSLSDARDKKNISDIPLGLNFIMNIKPRIFNWDRREWYDNKVSDGSKMDSVPTAGFVAQELDEVQNQYNAEWLKLVMKDNPEKWEATYGNLLPVMVKAIQELNEENDKLKKQIEALLSLEERLNRLEFTVMKQDILKEIKTSEK